MRPVVCSIVSEWSPGEVVRRLEDRIIRERSPVKRQFFAGRVDLPDFELAKYPMSMNSFYPRIRGKILRDPDGEGSLIDIEAVPLGAIHWFVLPVLSVGLLIGWSMLAAAEVGPYLRLATCFFLVALVVGMLVLPQRLFRGVVHRHVSQLAGFVDGTVRFDNFAG